MAVRWHGERPTLETVHTRRNSTMQQNLALKAGAEYHKASHRIPKLQT
jgi:hypothetical protein